MTSDAPPFDVMRQAMVTSQLRTFGVNDTRVIKAMADIPREAFVPPERRAIAYAEQPVPLGRGRALNLPMSTGRLLHEAYLRRDDRVLLIGAASGYTAAVLARIVVEVVAVEVDPVLAGLARDALADEPGVTVFEGPLGGGCPARAPFDVLVVDGAVERLPDALLKQLVPGGRILSGLIERGVHRLASGRRSPDGFGLAPFVDAQGVELPGFSSPSGFRF